MGLLGIGDPPKCSLISSFVARQAIILIAGIAFLIYTWVRVKLGYEQRDLVTFVADVSKQGGQQMFGGAILAITGVFLSENAEHGLDALAWYGAEYPFEIVLTTLFTSWIRNGCDALFSSLEQRYEWSCLKPFVNFGQYGPSPGTFLCSWYAAQLVQAVLIIGVGARITSMLLIVGSLELPEMLSPVLLVGNAWFYSGMSCTQRTVATLYVMPVVGDAIQFIIIDSIQRFRGRPSVPLASTADGSPNEQHSLV